MRIENIFLMIVKAPMRFEKYEVVLQPVRRKTTSRKGLLSINSQIFFNCLQFI